MNKKITVIAGDGIGAEIILQSVKVLEAIAAEFKHKFTITRALTGSEATKKFGAPLPTTTIEMARQSDAILVGTHAKGQPPLQDLKKALNLFVHFRPVTTFKSLVHLSPLKPKQLEKVDLVLVREPEELLSFNNSPAEEASLVAFEKRVHFAFGIAQMRRKQLICIEIAAEENSHTRNLISEISSHYPEVSVDFLTIETALPALLINPGQFDVVLSNAENGKILESQASLLTGPAGISPAASLGATTGYFEPIPLTNPPIAGRDTANPIGSILSVALLLEYLGLPAEAGLVREGVHWTLNNGFVTKDIDATNFYYTSTIGDLVSEFILGKIPDAINHSNIEIRKSTII